MTTNFDSNADFGECQAHNRPYECFSVDSRTLICPSCLMFGPNKGERVCSIEEAARELRAKIDEAARNGMFKVDKTESVLLDIRQTKLHCEEGKARVLKEVDETFNTLIKKLKDRKTEVIREIEEHYDGQFAMIKEEEQKWTEKQDISVDLLQLAKGVDDNVLVVKANDIYGGLDNINQPLVYHNTQILSTMDTNLKVHMKEKNYADLSLKELLYAFNTYVQKR